MKYLLPLFALIAFTSHSQTDTLSVFFDYDEYELSSDSKLALSTVDTFVLQIHAYCDTNGTVDYNKKLAKKRLTSVCDFLGKPCESAIRQSIGEPERLIENYNPDEWRRVDVIYPTEEVVVIDPTGSRELIDSLEAFLRDSARNEVKIDLTIQFYPGLPIVLPEYEAQLWELFNFFHYNQNVTGFIRGHVCCADDYPLSYARAEVVYNYLIDRSISRKRLDYAGYSNTLPAISPEITDEDRQQNRRVDVIFTKTQ